VEWFKSAQDLLIGFPGTFAVTKCCCPTWQNWNKYFFMSYVLFSCHMWFFHVTCDFFMSHVLFSCHMCLPYLGLVGYCKGEISTSSRLSPSMLSSKNQRGYQTIDRRSGGQCRWFLVLSGLMYQVNYVSQFY
jgi:hypothetical protein